MTLWEQVDAFENEVKGVVERFHEEFDIPVACLEGVLIQVGREFAEDKRMEFEAEIPEEKTEEGEDFLGVS